MGTGLASSRLCAALECSTAFVPSRRDQRTCGARCRLRLRNQENNARISAARATARERRLCNGCSITFSPRRSDALYCTRRCYNRTVTRRRQAARATYRACHECSADISTRRADAAYCSESCSRAAFRRANRACYVAAQQQRVALQHEATVGNGVPVVEWRRILKRSRGRCAYCGLRRVLTMDHVVPLSRGGRHSIGNVVAACGSCNSSKNSRLLVEWRKGDNPLGPG